jgi:hypothetical protein
LSTFFDRERSLLANEQVKLKANRDTIWPCVVIIRLLTKTSSNRPDIRNSIGFQTFLDAFIGYQVSSVITAQKGCSHDSEDNISYRWAASVSSLSLLACDSLAHAVQRAYCNGKCRWRLVGDPSPLVEL